MSMITYPLTIDTSRKNAFKTVLAQQYDTQSRTLLATLQNDNEKFNADITMTAVLYVIDEEHTQLPPLACTINEDGTVSVPISSLIITQRAGLYDCSLVIFNAASERLGTFVFSLEVERSATVPIDTFSDESVELLTQLIGEASGAIGGAELAAQNANAAAERAEQAAEQLAVDLSEIHQEIDDTNTRIDGLDANQIGFEESSDPEVELVSDALIKNASDIENLGGRMETAEGDIDELEQKTDGIESRLQGVQYKSERVTTINQSSDDNHYPTAKAVYSQAQGIRYDLDALTNEVDNLADDTDELDGRLTSAEGSITTLNNGVEWKNRMTQTVNAQSTQNQYPSAQAVYNAVNIKENAANKVQEITDDQTSNDYPSVPAVIDYIDGELANVQAKGEKVFTVNAQSTNNTYPSSKAVYEAIQAGGGASATMITFTITGMDASGNYTGVADKTFTEITTAIGNGGIVSGQIALGTDNYISYSTMANGSTVQFYIAAPGVIYSLVAEYSESGGTEQAATFTAYAAPYPDLTPLWNISRYVLQGNNSWNSATKYKFQASLFGAGINTIVVQVFSASVPYMYLRNLRDGTYTELYINDIATALTEAGVPNQVSTIANKNAVTFEISAGQALVYDLADSTVKVTGLALADSQINLIARTSVNAVSGLFVDFAHDTGNQSATIAFPT